MIPIEELRQSVQQASPADRDERLLAALTVALRQAQTWLVYAKEFADDAEASDVLSIVHAHQCAERALIPLLAEAGEVAAAKAAELGYTMVYETHDVDEEGDGDWEQCDHPCPTFLEGLPCRCGMLEMEP